MKTLRASIIIVSYNAKNDLAVCLRTIFEFTKTNFEIIVVDNASTDGSGEMVAKKFPKVKLIENRQNLGFAQANNLGAKIAQSDYLVLLNQDTLVSRDWLLELLAPFCQDKKIGIVQPKIKIYRKNQINSTGSLTHFLGFTWAGNCFEPDCGFEKNAEIFSASGCVLAIRRKLWQKLGGFDQDYFMYLEDVDLGWRTRLLGYKIIFAPKSIIYHKYHFSKGDYKYFYLEKNRLATLFKNYSSVSLLIFSPAIILSEFILLLYFIPKGKLKIKLRGLAAFFASLPKIWQKRKKIQKTRKISDQKIFSQFSTTRQLFRAVKKTGL
ncbi:MAG TPA: glycosyltransferase family 2 protein [Patescibacteria group bacterium]|nr:glycosyltransferase family 2 protein [Patescibacteria group bacterium]